MIAAQSMFAARTVPGDRWVVELAERPGLMGEAAAGRGAGLAAGAGGGSGGTRRLLGFCVRGVAVSTHRRGVQQRDQRDGMQVDSGQG